MRKVLSIIVSIILSVIVLVLLKSGGVILIDYITEVMAGLTILIFPILYWGFKSEIDGYLRGKSEVIIQKNSLRFYKYPYLVISKQRQQRMSNMAYATITVENFGKIKSNECEIEIQLKNDESYCSKVLSSLSADSQGRPNPKMVSIDGNNGTMDFHPLALRLDTLQAFLPNHSLGVAGSFTGTLVNHEGYEIFGKAIYDGKQSEITPLGRIKIPDDFLKKAVIPHDIQVLLNQGGFAVYLEHYQDKTRAKFNGHCRDEEIIRIILNNLIKIPRFDKIFEDNGRLRHWEIKKGVLHLSGIEESSS
ncbi:MAG: hypothetical protein NWE89_13525 [Candidatus Bathyarchaeota archaeon]|nr:hypothetical protein [Candidatus Bathyarchaeota archaeon]